MFPLPDASLLAEWEAILTEQGLAMCAGRDSRIMYFADMPRRGDPDNEKDRLDPSGYFPRSKAFDYSLRFAKADGHIHANFLRRGVRASDETRARMSETHKRQYATGERVAWWKGKKSPRFGIPLSEHAKRILSEKAKARPRKPLSEETRRKISERLTGIKRSDETRRKVSAANYRRYRKDSNAHSNYKG